MNTPYVYGEPLSDAERDAVINSMIVKTKRKRGLAPAKVFAGLYSLVPNLVEHLVNKQRGIAFDAGEDGFSYQRVA